MYSIAVDVQGKLIEVLSGKPLDEYFAESIFKPLAMNDTGFHVPADKLDRMTVNYGKKDGKLSPVDGAKDSQFATKPARLSGGRRPDLVGRRLSAVLPNDAQPWRT